MSLKRILARNRVHPCNHTMASSLHGLGSLTRRAVSLAPFLTRAASAGACSNGVLRARPSTLSSNPASFWRVAHASGVVDFVGGKRMRWLSGEAEKEKLAEEGAKAGQAAESAEDKKPGADAQQQAEPSETEKLAMQLQEKVDLIKKKDDEINDLKKRILTSLADVENMRVRMKKQSEEDKKFAARSVAKSMLDVADVLEKALAAMPEEKRKDNPDLQTVFEGVDMTDRIFQKQLEGLSVKKFHPMDEKFDPNTMQALFEIPAGEGEKGMVKAVIKSGYMIHDRVLRPAEVGVTK